jgi:hypothetical protein
MLSGISVNRKKFNKKIRRMKAMFKISLALILLITLTTSCDKSNKDDIVYQSVNEEFVFIRNVKQLQESDDAISNHIDSILSGNIDTDIISTGKQKIDLNGDGFPDIGFEIVNLNLFNPQGLPESYDSLAAKVIPFSINILDNSTYGYADALNQSESVAQDGYWQLSPNYVLGTFANAGQFQGKGEMYLGIRFPASGDGSKNKNYKYGWVKLYCSQHSDTLRIIEFAFNNNPGGEIKAGQKK